jgi:lipopolysaccharide transport system ATP-binding protein
MTPPLPCIDVKSVAKRYRIGTGIMSLADLFRLRKPKYEYHWAVKDVSFQLFPGESLGIIGPNGAGKTTMLKLLSNVTKPTSGEIVLNGRFSALIELGAGFHPDLTGRENVFLNGTILGMSRAEIAGRFSDIVDFAGIHQYIDTPVKRYSSGMYARLGFAIAAHVDPDILLVDEVLAVGDHAFQLKCYARMDELRKRGTSLIFVSHNMDAVRRVCERGLVMYLGAPIFEGSSSEAVVAYSDAVRNAAREMQIRKLPLEGGLSERIMTFDAEIRGALLLNEQLQVTNVVRSGSTVTLVLDVHFQNWVEQPVFALSIHTIDGRRVYTTTTKWMNMETPDFVAGDRCEVRYKFKLPLINGTYDLGANVASADLSHYYDRIEKALTFQVVDSPYAKGIVNLEASIEFLNRVSENGEGQILDSHILQK